MCNIKTKYIKLDKSKLKFLTFILLINIITLLNFNNIIASALNTDDSIKVANHSYKKVPSLMAPSKGMITSNFGERKGEKHHGIDIASKIGTPIKASYNGVVTKVDYHDIYGKRVIVSHGDGVETLYAHCSSIIVKKGENVIRGQHIANMGSTGRSTGPHIHFELRVNGKAINPINYIK